MQLNFLTKSQKVKGLVHTFQFSHKISKCKGVTLIGQIFASFANFAKLNPREIFANSQTAKLNPREIFRNSKFAKFNPREIF